MSSFRADWVDAEAARYAVEHWHYSRSLPTPPRLQIGLWEQGRFVGVVIFSRGASPNIGKPFGLDQTAVAELTRIAMRKHETPVTRAMRFALKLLRERSPGIRLVISYADPAHGHHGAIYQAAGWVYLGQGQGTTEYLAPDGKRWHSRMISPSGVRPSYGEPRAVWRVDQCTPIRLPGKHKYALGLDDEMRAQLAPLSKPYPARVGSREVRRVAHQPREGGSTPTPALKEATP